MSHEMGCNMYVAMFRKPFSVEQIRVRVRKSGYKICMHMLARSQFGCVMHNMLLVLLLLKVRIACCMCRLHEVAFQATDIYIYIEAVISWLPERLEHA